MSAFGPRGTAEERERVARELVTAAYEAKDAETMRASVRDVEALRQIAERRVVNLRRLLVSVRAFLPPAEQGRLDACLAGET